MSLLLFIIFVTEKPVSFSLLSFPMSPNVDFCKISLPPWVLWIFLVATEFFSKRKLSAVSDHSSWYCSGELSKQLWDVFRKVLPTSAPFWHGFRLLLQSVTDHHAIDGWPSRLQNMPLSLIWYRQFGSISWDVVSQFLLSALIYFWHAFPQEFHVWEGQWAARPFWLCCVLLDINISLNTIVRKLKQFHLPPYWTASKFFRDGQACWQALFITRT